MIPDRIGGRGMIGRQVLGALARGRLFLDRRRLLRAAGGDAAARRGGRGRGGCCGQGRQEEGRQEGRQGGEIAI